MRQNKTLLLKTEVDTQAIATELAKSLHAPAVIFLEGELGAGKTTFVRGFLRALGYQGRVKSPTFTLVESYDLDDVSIAHFDLYRLKNSAELELIGCRDYFDENTICLIEWASLASDYLPAPTILCKLKMPADGIGRQLELIWQGDKE